jgi:hypothetical protein
MKNILVMGDFLDINSWNFIIENESEYIKGRIRFDNHSYKDILSIKKEEEGIGVQQAFNTPLGNFLSKFSPFIYYTEEEYRGGYLITMTDLRFTFSFNLGRQEERSYSHTFGGYVVLDKQYNPTYWSVDPPK